MIDLTISSYVICLGFIAGLWDRENQRESPRGWERKDQALKTALKTNDPRFEPEKPRPEDDVALIPPFAPETSQLSRATVILSEASTGHKEVEFDDKGK